MKNFIFCQYKQASKTQTNASTPKTKIDRKRAWIYMWPHRHTYRLSKFSEHFSPPLISVDSNLFVKVHVLHLSFELPHFVHGNGVFKALLRRCTALSIVLLRTHIVHCTTAGKMWETLNMVSDSTTLLVHSVLWPWSFKRLTIRNKLELSSPPAALTYMHHHFSIKCPFCRITYGSTLYYVYVQ